MLYLISALGCAFALNWTMFVLARFIGGLGIGASSVLGPMYIAEIAPPKQRGKMVGMFQFNIVFGIVVAYVSNWLLAGVGQNAWRWMLGVAAFPSLLYALMCLGLPESPRWLLSRKGNREAALHVLQQAEPELSSAEVAAEADLCVCSAELRLIRADAQIARQANTQPGPHGEAVDRCDGDFGDVVEQVGIGIDLVGLLKLVIRVAIIALLVERGALVAEALHRGCAIRVHRGRRLLSRRRRRSRLGSQPNRD